jgi:hypothetical protein
VKIPVLKKWIPDLGSRVPNPYFLELSDKILGKKFYNSLKTGPNFFFRISKIKFFYNFVKFLATEKVMTTIFFHPSFLLLFLDPRSEIRDPRSGIRDPGSEIRDPRSEIRDPKSGIRGG